jgi:DNA-binding transcriptional regulator YhcF (GntR family)
MFRVKIDRAESTDLHEQVAAEIRRAIAEGEAKPGERLPPARDLAAVVAQARVLASLARKYGYRRDDLIRIIDALE